MNRYDSFPEIHHHDAADLARDLVRWIEASGPELGSPLLDFCYRLEDEITAFQDRIIVADREAYYQHYTQK